MHTLNFYKSWIPAFAGMTPFVILGLDPGIHPKRIIQEVHLINQYNPHRFEEKQCLITVENSSLEMVGAYIDRGVGGVGEICPFEMSVTEQRPFEIAQTKVSFLKLPIAKIDLFGSALPHHQPFQIQTKKIAIIEDTFPKTQGVGIEKTLPIRHRPIDPDHLARNKLDIAHFATGEFHEAQITVFKTTFSKFAGGKKGLTEITRDESTIIEFGFGDLFAVEINPFEFLGEYVHVVGDHLTTFLKYSSIHGFLIDSANLLNFFTNNFKFSIFSI